MTKTTAAYRLGRAWGRLGWAARGATLALVAVAAAFIWADRREDAQLKAEQAEEAELAIWQKQRASYLNQKCVVDIASQAALAASAVKGGLPQDAVNLLLECEDTMTDAKAIALLNAAREAQSAQEAKAAHILLTAQKQQRKREGVAIGMSPQDVLDSSWGRPNRINRTTTAGGEREQWVYDSGYLYFVNGVLTTIQN